MSQISSATSLPIDSQLGFIAMLDCGIGYHHMKNQLISIDWFSREKLKENPSIFLGKPGWFPVSRFSHESPQPIDNPTIDCDFP